MRRTGNAAAAGLLGLALALAPGRAAPDETAALLARVQAVGAHGVGNAEAGRAWQELVRRGPGVLLDLLAAVDDEDPVAANWLRTAVDAVAEQAVRAGKPLPADRLERFIGEKGHAAGARRLAYEWLVRVDPTAPARLLPGMLHDPSRELRRDAVERAVAAADALLKAGQRDRARAAYRRALAGASDRDQVDALAGKLTALGVAVDRAAHLGCVRRWHLAAPFDNTGEAGFRTAYPPERGVDLLAKYAGKGGKEAHWVPYTTSDPYGVVDLNKVLGKQKATVAYARAVVVSPAGRAVQVRVGAINAVKVFLNGKEVLAREEYHHGMEMDQYVARATLRAGPNELLVKVCQNNQSEAWAQSWKFQLRLTDASGAAVPWQPAPGDASGKGDQP